MASKRVARLQRQARQQSEEKQIVAQKAVGYVRVSTDEQASAGYGLDAQEKAIKAFAESQGYELIEIVQDAGISGATRPEERPGFCRIIQLAEEKAFSILLVWKFDRLARHLGYAVTTVNQLQDMGIALRSVTEPIDTSSPMGQTIFAVLAGMAAQERLTIIQRTLAGKKEKASRGGFAGGPAPLGYARDKDGGLRVVAEEADTVRRIYTLRKQGLKLQEIADILNAEGVPTKRGGRWYPGTVRYILDNPKYQGYVEYYFRWDGEQYVIKEGQHQAILPKVS